MLFRSHYFSPLVFLVAFAWTIASAQTPSDTNGEDRPRQSLRAVFTADPIVVDGELDEAAWATATLAGTFIQRDPNTGQPASEPTEVRILYNKDYLYIGIRCAQRDTGQIIVNNIRRDYPPNDQDTFAFLLDTFHDRRSGYTFSTTPRGGQRDQQFTDNGRVTNANWDGVWLSASRIHEKDWTAEFAIPFKTLRFRPQQAQNWGLNLYRYMQHNGEASSWVPLPRRYVMQRGVGIAGDLTGLEGIKPGKNIYVKPYVLGGANWLGSQRKSADGDAKAGADLKYGDRKSTRLNSSH